MLHFSSNRVPVGLVYAGILLFFFLQTVQAKTGLLTPDGAFTLFGSSSIATSRFSRILSEYEKQFYKITGYTPGEAPPIIIVIPDTGNDGLDNSTLRMDALEDGLPKIQINLSGNKPDKANISYLLAQALLLREYYSTKAPTPGSHIAEFPTWLLHGLGRLSDPESKPVIIPSSYLHGAVSPSVEDLLAQKTPDDSNQELLDIYNAMSSSLLSAGLKGSDGGNAFRKWVGHFNPNFPRQLPSCWPPDWSMKSVERRWLLLMAGMSGEDSEVVAQLGIRETLDRYDEILSEVTTLNHSLALMKKKKGADYLVQQLANRFAALRLQANPLTVPLLDETMLLCSKLRRLPEKKITLTEKALSDKRMEILKRSHSIDAYLDWFEATKLPMKSGLFENALKEPGLAIRKGPVGRYLDTIEARGW